MKHIAIQDKEKMSWFFFRVLLSVSSSFALSRGALGVWDTSTSIPQNGSIFRYQINARTELAVRYKDESPLENHHWAVTHSILHQRECDIFLNLSPTEREAVHKDIALLILATDMAKHERILKEFKEKSHRLLSSDFDIEDKRCLKMILIKACDVSNEIRPPEISEPWVEKLLEEYFQQVKF